MDKDFSELVEYLDQKFVKIDERFMKIDERLGRLEDNKADKSDINELMDAIDAYAKRADAYFQEMLMLAQKVDRHERWLQ